MERKKLLLSRGIFLFVLKTLEKTHLNTVVLLNCLLNPKYFIFQKRQNDWQSEYLFFNIDFKFLPFNHLFHSEFEHVILFHFSPGKISHNLKLGNLNRIR